MTDAQLIQASIAGDETAFKTLVQNYESMVASVVIGMLGHGQEAEDAGQETFIRFYQSLSHFRGEASLGTYLTRIAMNLSLNAIKRRKRNFLRFRPLELVYEKELSGPSENGYDDTAEWLHRAIRSLKPEFRAVIVLRFFKERSIREIADILDIPQGTVLSRLTRGQQKLRSLLQPLLGEGDETEKFRPAAQVL